MSFVLTAVGGCDSSRVPEIAPEIVEIVMLEDRRESSDSLLAYLNNPDPVIRARAALAVGRIGRADDVASLSSLLADPAVNVRRMAAFGLGEIPDSSAATPLAELLLNGEESDAIVREYAVEALGKLRWGGDACRVAFDDPAASVRARAFLSAWRIPVPKILDDVIDACAEENPEIRWSAAYCLMRIAGAPASGRTPIATAAPLLSEEREEARNTFLALLSDADTRVRLQAARGLRTFGGDSVMQALMELTSDADWRVRVEALRALSAEVEADDGPAPRGVPIAALTPLFEDPHPNVRIEAVAALAGVGSAIETLPLLLGHLQRPERRVQEVAVGALSRRWREMGDPIPADVLDQIERVCGILLDREHWSIRASAVDAAQLLPPERGRPILERLATDDPRVAKLAAQPLMNIVAANGTGPLWPRIQPTLDELMATEDEMVRLMLVVATGELFENDSTYAPMETDWASFEHFVGQSYEGARRHKTMIDLREATIGVAAEFVDRPEMRSLLITACDDPKYAVRRAAVSALEAGEIDPPRRAEPPETTLAPSDYEAVLRWARDEHWAVLDADAGEIVAVLYAEDAPLTLWNFATLANDGFYDNGAWHRVVPDFVLQDGCPRGDGWGGPDWQIRCEINPRRYVTGALGVALSGKDTGGSQFFFTHSDQPHLDGGYTVFGRIERGQDVADRVVQGSGIASIRVVDRRP